jgi:DnaJ-class molecular chaperone
VAESEPQPKPRFETLAVDPFAGEIADVILELRLPRETLATGAKVPVAITRRVPCSVCKGVARDEGTPACTECERGYTKVDASVEVEVPPGAGPGMQLRVPGQGHARPDKPQGDVVVVLAAGAPEASAAAQKLPLFVVFVIVTIIVLILAVQMAR